MLGSQKGWFLRNRCLPHVDVLKGGFFHSSSCHACLGQASVSLGAPRMPTNLLHHGPQNRIQKTSRNMAARKGPRLYKKQSGTHREKKHVLTLTLMLVRRKSACKTSAGSSKILRWLTPLLGPNLDPKTGPKQRPKRRNENVIQFWTPFGPKNGVSHRRISLLPAHVVQAHLRPCSLNMNVNSYLFLFVRPKSGCYVSLNLNDLVKPSLGEIATAGSNLQRNPAQAGRAPQRSG